MGVFAGTERQCTEDEHDDEDENDSQISELGINRYREAFLRPTGPAVVGVKPTQAEARLRKAYVAAR
jgi:hypothetical protein